MVLRLLILILLIIPFIKYGGWSDDMVFHSAITIDKIALFLALFLPYARHSTIPNWRNVIEKTLNCVIVVVSLFSLLNFVGAIEIIVVEKNNPYQEIIDGEVR